MPFRYPHRKLSRLFWMAQITSKIIATKDIGPAYWAQHSCLAWGFPPEWLLTKYSCLVTAWQRGGFLFVPGYSFTGKSEWEVTSVLLCETFLSPDMTSCFWPEVVFEKHLPLFLPTKPWHHLESTELDFEAMMWAHIWWKPPTHPPTSLFSLLKCIREGNQIHPVTLSTLLFRGTSVVLKPDMMRIDCNLISKISVILEGALVSC